MVLGWLGKVADVTESVLAVLVPQALPAVTEMEPLEAPTVTVTELVVPPPVCVHPDGNVQL